MATLVTSEQLAFPSLERGADVGETAEALGRVIEEAWQVHCDPMADASTRLRALALIEKTLTHQAKILGII